LREQRGGCVRGRVRGQSQSLTREKVQREMETAGRSLRRLAPIPRYGAGGGGWPAGHEESAAP